MSPPTFSCGTWTWPLWVVLTVVALKWSQRGCPFSTGLSWPLTQLWSLPCALMESHIANVPLLMELLCKPPAAARRGRTQNLLEHKGAPDLSFWLPRWVADGQRKRVASSVSLPAPRSGHCPRSSVLALSSPGTSVGGPFSLALPREL